MRQIKPTKKPIVINIKNPLKILCILFLLLGCEKEKNNDVRDDFVGNWLVNENSSLLGLRSYEVTIFKDSINNSGINIYNFYKLGIEDSVFSTISGIEGTTLTIPSQTSKSNIIEGSGKIKKDEIDINYFINDGNQIDTVSANYTRDDD
tara:strand:+ start:124 stop:570 length:447 start_codon:yes stop_codon:yes gene_type:complete